MRRLVPVTRAGVVGSLGSPDTMSPFALVYTATGNGPLLSDPTSGLIVPDTVAYASQEVLPALTAQAAGSVSPASISYNAAANATVVASQANGSVLPSLVAYSASPLSPTLSGAAAPDVARLDSWSLTGTDATSPGSRAVAAGTNRLTLAFINYRSGPGETTTTLSYGGEAMVKLAGVVTSAAGAETELSLWWLKEAGIAAAVGTAYTLTASSTSEIQFRMMTGSFENVDQVTPMGSINSDDATGGGTPSIGSLTPEDGGFVVAGVGNSEAGGADAVWSSVTEQLEELASSSYLSVADAAGTGAAVTPSVAVSNFANSVLIAATINKA